VLGLTRERPGSPSEQADKLLAKKGKKKKKKTKPREIRGHAKLTVRGAGRPEVRKRFKGVRNQKTPEKNGRGNPRDTEENMVNMPPGKVDRPKGNEQKETMSLGSTHAEEKMPPPTTNKRP